METTKPSRPRPWAAALKALILLAVGIKMLGALSLHQGPVVMLIATAIVVAAGINALVLVLQLIFR